MPTPAKQPHCPPCLAGNQISPFVRAEGVSSPLRDGQSFGPTTPRTRQRPSAQVALHRYCIAMACGFHHSNSIALGLRCICHSSGGSTRTGLQPPRLPYERVCSRLCQRPSPSSKGVCEQAIVMPLPTLRVQAQEWSQLWIDHGLSFHHDQITKRLEWRLLPCVEPSCVGVYSSTDSDLGLSNSKGIVSSRIDHY